MVIIGTNKGLWFASISLDGWQLQGVGAANDTHAAASSCHVGGDGHSLSVPRGWALRYMVHDVYWWLMMMLNVCWWWWFVMMVNDGDDGWRLVMVQAPGDSWCLMMTHDTSWYLASMVVYDGKCTLISLLAACPTLDGAYVRTFLIVYTHVFLIGCKGLNVSCCIPTPHICHSNSWDSGHIFAH